MNYNMPEKTETDRHGKKKEQQASDIRVKNGENTSEKDKKTY